MTTIHVLLLVLIFAVFPLRCSTDTGDILLSVKGKPCAAIVVSADAIPAEKTAAKELANHLKLVTGADFPIVSNASQASKGMCIYIGQTKSVRKIMPDFDFSKLGRDGIIIRRVGNNLVLAGDRPRGTLYAVYTFLEDNVGCRWWTPKASYMPKKPTLRVRVKDITYTPPFMCRETFYKSVIGQNSEFATRLKLNGHFQSIPPELGGHYNILGFCHTFYQLIPPDKYFADHPEWFSEIGGKRMHDGAQLCLTNDEMRKELTKNALEWIKKDPEAGIISIALNDAFRACECPKCHAIAEHEGSEMGPIITFVNAVAEDIEKEYPEFLVETIAYTYPKAPAHIKPRQNVVVRLCSIACDFSKPITAPSNKEFYTNLKAWSAISPRLYIWDYLMNLENLLAPQPNWRAIGPNIRLFVKSNVISVFEQGDGYNPDANFAEMRTWLMAHLIWNPKANESKLIDEFLAGNYGPATKYMRQYIDLTCDAMDKSGEKLPIFTKTFGFFTPDVLNEATRIFDAAVKSVQGDAELLKRVRLQRLSLYYVILLNAPADGLPSGADLKRISDEFLTLSDQTGNNFWHEGTVLPSDLREKLKAKVSESKP